MSDHTNFPAHILMYVGNGGCISIHDYVFNTVFILEEPTMTIISHNHWQQKTSTQYKLRLGEGDFEDSRNSSTYKLKSEEAPRILGVWTPLGPDYGN